MILSVVNLHAQGTGAMRNTRTVINSKGDTIRPEQKDTQTVVADSMQKSKTKPKPTNVGEKTILDIPQSYDRELERLADTWYKGYAKIASTKGREQVSKELFTDSAFIKRLSSLPTTIPIEYNSEIKEAIELFLKKRSRLISFVLSMGDLYFPLMDEVLDKHKLPVELKYLTIIESGLNPRVVSPAGASGLWQFMMSTGKIYDLEINSLVDERMSLSQSTEAAAKMLRDMHNIYGDWLLVMAAYNCGAGRVNQAIKRAGGVSDFWAIYRYLPRETRKYIPLFIGAYYAMTYHKDYNISAATSRDIVATDTIMIDRPVTFKQVSDLTGTSIDDIRNLNPQYKRELIPGNVRPYPLRLPLKSVLLLNNKLDELPQEQFKVNMTESYDSSPSSTSESKGGSLYYTVKRGDNLGKIARKFGTTTKSIKRLNGMKSNHVRRGQRLLIRR